MTHHHAPDRCVATIIDVTWPTCTARDAVTGDFISAVAGHALQELAIALRPGDHVVIEDAHPHPTVTFRFWHATATETHERHVVIDPPPSGGQRHPTVRLPRSFNLAPKVGQTVLCTREIVADIEAEGAPSNPDRLLTAYDHIRQVVTGPQACLRIPAEELPIDEPLVKALLREQFPQWADLSVRQVPSWENAMFRLDDDLAVRITRGRWALGQIEKELRWLPAIAAQLPLPITVPIALGHPGHGYPWTWSVCTWIHGDDATPERLTDMTQAGQDLAQFLRALQAIDATGGPVAGQPPHWYGWRPLADAAPTIRQTITAHPPHEQQILNDVLAQALAAPPWNGQPVWLHGDLHPSNVVARDGRLAGVIDFGVMSTGDPAYDYTAAYALLDQEGRQAFRTTLDIDDPTWARARGWAIARCANQIITETAS